jgi:hypothetical protein
MTSLQPSGRRRVRIREFSPRFRNLLMEPSDIAIRAGFIGLDCFLLPILLSFHTVICVFETQTLHIINKGAYFPLPKILERWHE